MSPATTSYQRLIAVDPSLTASGWAVFSIAKSMPITTGVFRPPGPTSALSDRLRILQELVQKFFDQYDFGQGDILVCEGPATLIRNPLSALQLERVRGIFEAVARFRGVAVPGRINPRTVQFELLGLKGKQLPREIIKKTALVVAKQLYETQLTKIANDNIPVKKRRSGNGFVCQDIVDALLIGTVAVAKVNICMRTHQDMANAFLPRLERLRLRYP